MRCSRRHTGVRARRLPPALADRTQLPMSKSDLLARPIYHHKATRSKPTPPSCSPPSRSEAGWNARPAGRSRSSSSPPPLPQHRDPHGRAHSPRLATVGRRQGWSSPLHSGRHGCANVRRDFLTTVCAAYPTPPLLTVFHPPIELASLVTMGRLDLDGWIDLPAISLGQLLHVLRSISD